MACCMLVVVCTTRPLGLCMDKKFCRYHSDRRCYWSSCSFLDSMGNVVFCSLVPDRDSFFVPKKSKPVLHPLFSKHLREGR